MKPKPDPLLHTIEDEFTVVRSWFKPGGSLDAAGQFTTQQAVDHMLRMIRGNERREFTCNKGCGWTFLITTPIPKTPAYRRTTWFCPHCGESVKG